MNLNGMLESIQNDVDVDAKNFRVNDMAKSLDGLVEGDGDVDMAEATPSAEYHHVDDVEMEDAASLHSENTPEVVPEKVSEAKAEVEESSSDKQKFSINPTSLGAKAATHGHNNAVVVAAKPPQKPQPTTETARLQMQMETQEPEYRMPIPTPAWIATHNNRAYIISTYMQLAFNGAVAFLALYIVWSGFQTFWQDVDFKLDSYSSMRLTDIQTCTRKYLENDCRPGTRAPALEADCERWEKCMNQDHMTTVGRTRATAEVVAEMINSFIEPFSYKTILVTLLTTILALFISNFAFGFWRAKAYYREEQSIRRKKLKDSFVEKS